MAFTTLRIIRRIYSNSVLVLASSQRRHLSVQSMNEAITKAELCLGYSIKDLSVKQMPCNQKIRSLMEKKSLSLPTEHPVLLAERKLDPEIEVNYKSRAFLTLLLSKAVSDPTVQTSPQFKFDLNLNKSGFLAKQLLLAETIELIYGGCLFHTIGVSPIKDSTSNTCIANTVDNIDALLNGNRLAILSGDLMFSSATKNLVKLKNTRVTELMSKALRDFIEGEYVGIKIREQIETGEWTDILENWVRMTGLKSSSLIANGCQSMVHLSANCQSLEESVYKFGNNIGFAWNVSEELENFRHLDNQIDFNINIDSLYSLPILLHLNSNPGLKNYMNSYENKRKFIENIKEEVNKSDAIKKTKSLLDFYCDNSLDQIKHFADSEAKTALINIVLAMKLNSH